MPGYELGRLTWPQVRVAAAHGWPVLIPIGTVETQGLHAPMGYDYIVAERLAIAAAERVECIVCPKVPYGYSHFSKPFPGTISLRPQTLQLILEDICESLIPHGFRRLIVINNHTSSDPVVGFVADLLRERHGLSLASISPSKLARDLGRDLYDSATIFAHGGEPALSLLSFLTPQDIRMDNLERRVYTATWHGFPVAGPASVRVGESMATVHMDFAQLAPEGGVGDATQASAERGRIMFERMTAALCDFVTKFRSLEI